MFIEIEGYPHYVQITYKKMKNIVLKVSENGNLYISCPFHTKDSTIQEFLASKEKWIIKAFKRQEHKQTYIQPGSDFKTAVWFGKTYSVRCEQDDFDTMTFEKDEIVFKAKIIDEMTIESLFYQSAGNALIREISKIRDVLDKEICDTYQKKHPSITIKYMTSRWGSCNPHNSRISISVRLIHYPIECLKYVMVHEYAHLLVPNHSKAFYDVVKQIMPNYKEIERILK